MFHAGAFFTYLCCRCQMGRRPHSHPIGRLEESALYSHPKRKVTHFTAGVDGGREMSSSRTSISSSKRSTDAPRLWLGRRVENSKIQTWMLTREVAKPTRGMNTVRSEAGLVTEIQKGMVS